MIIATVLQRLAEMLPRWDYQSRLEQYIISRQPQSAADVEQFEREFLQRQNRGTI